MSSASIRVIGMSIVFVGVLAGCGTDDSTVPATPTVSSAAASRAPSSGPKVGETDTDWGRIWDGLPAGFPKIPGATPDEEATGGPASAVFVIEGPDAKQIATSWETLLTTAGYTNVGSLEPLEDGSVVLDMTGPAEGCMLQVTATPTGGLTTVRILYGSACPFS